MPEAGLLDTLVKLASLGTSGICIFVVFWIGWLLSRPVTDGSGQRERTLRLFMAVCLVIAVVSAAAAMLGNARENDSLRKTIADLQKQAETRDQPYTVEGIVQLDGGGDPGAVEIIAQYQYPIPAPDDRDGNFHLTVWKDGYGQLPTVVLTCRGYHDRNLTLNGTGRARVTDRRIEIISKAVLDKLPEN